MNEPKCSKKQEGAILSIEAVLLMIVAIAAAIVVLVAVLDILPLLKAYIIEWLTPPPP